MIFIPVTQQRFNEFLRTYSVSSHSKLNEETQRWYFFCLDDNLQADEWYFFGLDDNLQAGKKKQIGYVNSGKYYLVNPEGAMKVTKQEFRDRWDHYLRQGNGVMAQMTALGVTYTDAVTGKLIGNYVEGPPEEYYWYADNKKEPVKTLHYDPNIDYNW